MPLGSVKGKIIRNSFSKDRFPSARRPGPSVRCSGAPLEKHTPCQGFGFLVLGLLFRVLRQNGRGGGRIHSSSVWCAVPGIEPVAE